MRSEAVSVSEYLKSLDNEDAGVIKKLRKCVKDNLPTGFKEEMNYGMIGYVVPHKIFPAGYHCDPKLPLPFIYIGVQKNFIALYHLGIYADEKILEWFKGEYPKFSEYKLDMGKSCIRFKRGREIPFELIGKLVRKISVKKWIALYEDSRKGR